MYGVIEHVTVCVGENAAGLKCSFTTRVIIEIKLWNQMRKPEMFYLDVNEY